VARTEPSVSLDGLRLFNLRNEALERIQAGDERAETLLVAVDELIGELELETADPQHRP
jgi:hypothetical protein